MTTISFEPTGISVLEFNYIKIWCFLLIFIYKYLDIDFLERLINKENQVVWENICTQSYSSMCYGNQLYL